MAKETKKEGNEVVNNNETNITEARNQKHAPANKHQHYRKKKEEKIGEETTQRDRADAATDTVAKAMPMTIRGSIPWRQKPPASLKTSLVWHVAEKKMCWGVCQTSGHEPAYGCSCSCFISFLSFLPK